MNIKQLQINTIINKGKKLIEQLEERQGIYIIDKSLNVRVLFYYKPNIYFISDPFHVFINNSYIDINNSDELINACENISGIFESSDYLTNSKLIKNIDAFVEEYMIDTLAIVVDRVEMNILETASLEYYNDLIMINLTGCFKLLEIDGFICKYDITEALIDFKYTQTHEYFTELLYYLYDNNNLFPYNTTIDMTKVEKFSKYDLSNKEKFPPMFIVSNNALGNVVSYEKILINVPNLDYTKIYDTLYFILNIDKTSDYLLEDIKYIVDTNNNDKNTLIN